jgi:DNA-binding transcriptional regulator YiaG
MPTKIRQDAIHRAYVRRRDAAPTPPIVDVLGVDPGPRQHGTDSRGHLRVATNGGDRLSRGRHGQSIRRSDEKGNSKITPPLDSSPHRVEFGRRLRAARKAMGFHTARQFAAMLGVDEKALSGWERGARLPDVPMLARLCDALGVTTDWLLLGRAAGLPVSALTVMRSEAEK